MQKNVLVILVQWQTARYETISLGDAAIVCTHQSTTQKFSMRSSNSRWGGGGDSVLVISKVPKSSMRSSSSWGMGEGLFCAGYMKSFKVLHGKFQFLGGGILCWSKWSYPKFLGPQEYPHILGISENFPLHLKLCITDSLSHLMCVESNEI